MKKTDSEKNSTATTASGQGIVVRFAPSPTGFLHVGSARTALFNFLFAKKHGGKMILRIEDTDRERSKKEYEKDILEGLGWLSISHDALYRQSERTDVYKNYLEKLIREGTAYVSHEEPKEEGKRGDVIRFKNPGKTIVFHDLIRGEISFDTKELGDFVLAKDLETPLYHFAVVTDDFDMGVTHIIRGEDGISNTPRQILIQEALGAPRPVYAHIPFILAPDRSKLSKRHGAVSITEYRNMGFLPEALVNFLALIGWNPGGEREIFSLKELINEFLIEKVQKGGAIFNLEKLRWMNREYIKKMPHQEFRARTLEFLPDKIKKIPEWSEERFTAVLEILEERMSTFGDIVTMTEGGEIEYFFKMPEYSKEKLLWKEEMDHKKTRSRLSHIISLLGNIDQSLFTASRIKEALWDYATEEGRGQVLWPMRYALSGRDRSPDPFVLGGALGKLETIRRLERAVKKCDE